MLLKPKNPKIAANLQTMFLLGVASFPLHSLATDYLKDYAKNCASISNPTQRLECFDRVVKDLNQEKYGKPVSSDSWSFDDQNKTKTDDAREVFLHHEAAKVTLKKEHAGDRVFFRGSTDIGKKNEDAAQIALMRSGEQTTGSINAAVLYVSNGGILGFPLLDEESKSRFYLGVGTKRDDSDANAKVATNDVRVGYRRAHGIPREDEKTGHNKFLWISFARVANIAQKKIQNQVEGGYEWSHRWYEATKFGDIVKDRLATARLTPFSDRTVDETTGSRSTTTGAAIEASFSWYRPLFGGMLLAPDHFDISAKRIAGTGGSTQYSTMKKAALTWDLANRPTSRTQPSLTLTREIGSDFRAGASRTAKSLLTLDLKYN